MIGLLSSLLLAAATPAMKQAALTDQLKSNITKTDRAISITEEQVARSRVQPYAPEIQFRLAELYVEKSRYLYLLHQQDAGINQGSQVAPEVRLVKQKAIDLYERLLRDAPDWPGNDRTRFYLAHEFRELGQFERMLKLEEELADKHPKSPLAAEALMIVGDHWFSAKELGKAESAYQRVLTGPASPAQDLARFKMGWVRLNQNKHAEAVTFFEAAAASPLMDHASADVLNVKREALFDLVFSYTESRPWKGSVEYFEKLAGNHALFLGVLEKLANRYFIKQESEASVAAYRRLLQLSQNPDRDLEFAGRLHASLKAAGEKAPPKADDVRNIVRVAARIRTDEKLEAAIRKSGIEELELYARDLSTGMLLAAQKKAGIDPKEGVSKSVRNKQEFAEAADAHEAWLSLFRESPQRLAMERNYADALFAAERWHASGRAFEIVANESKDPREQADALYNALAAFAKAVPQDRTTGSSVLEGAWQIADARRGMALLGAKYVSMFPKSPRVAQVKFNVARAAYDAGEWKRAGELFAAFVQEHPNSSDAAVAADLALDSMHIAGDYEGLEKVGNEIASNSKVPATIRKEMQDVVSKSRSERLSTVALQSSAKTGDAAQGLVELSDQKPGSDIGEQALFAAFATYRDKKDLSKVDEVGRKYVSTYGKSAKVADVIATIARAAMEVADYDRAALQYEGLSQRYPNEAIGLDAARTAATLYLLLGDARKSMLLLEKVPPEKRDGGISRLLAEARLAVGDAAGAETAANAALAANPGDADAGVLLGRSMLAQKKAADASRRVQNVLAAARKTRISDYSMAQLWNIAGETSLRAMLVLPADPLDAKVAMLKQIQEATTSVAQLSAGDMAVEGIYRLAVGFDHLAQTLAGMPAPSKLSGDDKAQFLAAIGQQSAGLRQQAGQAFETCAQKAKELEVFSPFVAACQNKAPGSEQSLPLVKVTPAASSAAITAARAELKWGTPNAERLEALGVAQLESGDLRRARLSFQRALEVEDVRASAQAGLGVALARMGEVVAARTAYHRALELDPTLDRAHAGLAALFCKYGEMEQGKSELAKMRAKPNPAAADADPDLAKCGGAK